MDSKLELILKELDEQIAPLEQKRAMAESNRLESWDFSDKNYYNGVEQRYEAAIAMIEKIKAIVTKHLI